MIASTATVEPGKDQGKLPEIGHAPSDLGRITNHATREIDDQGQNRSLSEQRDEERCSLLRTEKRQGPGDAAVMERSCRQGAGSNP